MTKHRNDCGDWVAKWMIECAFNSHYDSETVSEITMIVNC
jgi:hypothetical protein